MGRGDNQNSRVTLDELMDAGTRLRRAAHDYEESVEDTAGYIRTVWTNSATGALGRKGGPAMILKNKATGHEVNTWVDDKVGTHRDDGPAIIADFGGEIIRVWAEMNEYAYNSRGMSYEKVSPEGVILAEMRLAGSGIIVTPGNSSLDPTTDIPSVVTRNRDGGVLTIEWKTESGLHRDPKGPLDRVAAISYFPSGGAKTVQYAVNGEKIRGDASRPHTVGYSHQGHLLRAEWADDPGFPVKSILRRSVRGPIIVTLQDWVPNDVKVRATAGSSRYESETLSFNFDMDGDKMMFFNSKTRMLTPISKHLNIGISPARILIPSNVLPPTLHNTMSVEGN